MKNTIPDGFKIICCFKKPTKKNRKALVETQKRLTEKLAYNFLHRFYEFIKKYGINLEDLAKGKVSIEDIRKKNEKMDVHDNLSKIIILIKDNPKVTLTEMAVAIRRCKKTVQRLIASTDKIVRLGSAKNGYWKVENSL